MDILNRFNLFIKKEPMYVEPKLFSDESRKTLESLQATIITLKGGNVGEILARNQQQHSPSSFRHKDDLKIIEECKSKGLTGEVAIFSFASNYEMAMSKSLKVQGDTTRQKAFGLVDEQIRTLNNSTVEGIDNVNIVTPNLPTFLDISCLLIRGYELEANSLETSSVSRIGQAAMDLSDKYFVTNDILKGNKRPTLLARDMHVNKFKTISLVLGCTEPGEISPNVYVPIIIIPK